MGGDRLAALVLASLALAAFSPPQSKREPAQQEPPKSWIPERKPGIEPPAVPGDPPQSGTTRRPADRTQQAPPSKYLHPKGVSCLGSPPPGPVKAAREFVEAFSQARLAVTGQRFGDALAFAEKAAPYATDARQWAAIEQIRVAALSALGDDANLIATLESLTALDCATPEQTIEHQEMLDGARERLKSPSAQ